MKTQVTFCGILYDVRMKRDGGGRVQIDFGKDALEEVIEMQRFFAENAVSVVVALAPYQQSFKDPDQLDVEEYLSEEPQEGV